MKARVEVVWEVEGGGQRQRVLAIERQNLALETLGLNLAESKTLLENVQKLIVTQQVDEELEQQRRCLQCGQQHRPKDSGHTTVRTVFGPVQLSHPRWKRCACQSDSAETFRPMTAWLKGWITPELLYLETKWASLLPFAKVAALLKDVLPVGESVNQELVHSHLQAAAEQIEEELDEERPLN